MPCRTQVHAAFKDVEVEVCRDKERERERDEAGIRGFKVRGREVPRQTHATCCNVQGEPTPTDAYPKASSTS